MALMPVNRDFEFHCDKKRKFKEDLRWSGRNCWEARCLGQI